MSKGKDTPRLARYEVGIDSYRAARILIDKHGAEAAATANRRMQELVDLGDQDGATTWADILFAIGEIQRGPRPGDAWN
ncbi:hypothetical protein EAH89_30365 [Roseomonas nepalensis]|uniref:Uncharacterized protein n=1 Tax=Muricoccus nepalensis TaxID=1854500 RepID=A0A502EFN0_9PROT|nr:hypothetical protein [Roseomonas nepalensis]TPG36247.1 hypothetical protein EAH89_30365 [Roseomonas nepalensis]